MKSFQTAATYGGAWLCATGRGAWDTTPSLRFLEWTLTGRSICYINRETEPGPAIETFDIATGKVSRLAVLENSPTNLGLSVSPDGRWILYTVG